MMEKYANSVTGRRLHGLRLGVSLIAVLGAISLFSASATAAEQVTADPCDSALINQQEAKEIASSFMQQQGWARWIQFRATATTRFQIREANCLNGQWRVSVAFSRRIGSSHSRRGVVLINCHRGVIEETLRSA